jgi:DNA-binding NtrC family response regulator
MIEAGRFREDLFFRLNVFTIELPVLDDRRDDIPVLVKYFVARGSQRLGKRVDQVPSETMDRLLSHPWRGNVRELENVIDRALIVSTGPTLLPESISFAEDSAAAGSSEDMDDRALFDIVFHRLAARFESDPDHPILEALEHEMLQRAMDLVEGNQVQAARLLGISRQTLRNRLAQSYELPDKIGE